MTNVEILRELKELHGVDVVYVTLYITDTRKYYNKIYLEVYAVDEDDNTIDSVFLSEAENYGLESERKMLLWQEDIREDISDYYETVKKIKYVD